MRPNLCFSPELPPAQTAIRQLCDHLGIKVSQKITPATIAKFFWHDTTYKQKLPDIDQTFINANCLDISKSVVQRAFAQTFGYDLAVDPLTYVGQAVQKSEMNASHSGQIVNLPIKTPVDGMVYEKLVDSTEGKLATCLRITIFGQVIAAVYKHFRPADKRFAGGHEFVKVEMPEVDEVLSKDEQKKIIDFCQEIGMDYGDLDAPRDQHDQKLYIVDANPTPYYHPLRLGEDFHKQVLENTGQKFLNFLRQYGSR